MFLGEKKPVEVRRIGQTLVATFRNSNPPLIWKFDLARHHSFTLALQGDEGDLELGITSPKGEFYSIARFAVREDADLAFTAVQKVLMKKGGRFKKLLAWLGGILVLLGASILIAGYFASHTFPLMRGSQSSSASQTIPRGVPVPADQAVTPPN